MRKLTEVEAWNRIAGQIANGHWGRRGLCLEIHSLSFRITDETRESMCRRVDRHMRDFAWLSYDYSHSGYYDAVGRPHARILAALFLALEAAEDGSCE